MIPTPQLENLSARAWADAFAAAPTLAAEQLGLEARRVAGGEVLIAPGVDSLMFNAAYGVEPAGLAEFVELFAHREVRRYMLHLAPGLAPAHFEGWSQLALEPFHRPWLELRGAAVGQTAVAAGFDLRPAKSEDRAAVALYCRGFDLPDSARPIIAALFSRRGWRAYVATLDGVIVGVGLVFVDGSEAYLAGGVTDRPWRCRGVQAALISARLAHAQACGARFVHTETGVPVPDAPNHSQRNLERAGLRVVGLRHQLVPRGTSWTS